MTHPDEFAALRAALEAGPTPGPWRWELSLKSKGLHLCGGRPQFDLTIMDFERWGMSHATMRLRDTAHDGMNIMHKLHERSDWIAPFPGREHHAGWCANVTHPDAAYIAAASPEVIARLLAENSALKRNAGNMAEALLQSAADVEALMSGRSHEGHATARPHDVLAADLLFAGCYANETEPQAAVRRLKRNEAAARALLALDDEVERLRAEVDAARAELKVTDELLTERDRLLNAIPECEAHGAGCVPHALEWVAAMKAKP